MNQNHILSPESSYHVKCIRITMRCALKLPSPWFLNAVEEFEGKWWKMLDDHGQTDNEHFHWLWENRECWVPVYYMHDFFPFLQTTARSEGFNVVLKKYVNPNNSLVEFAK